MVRFKTAVEGKKFQEALSARVESYFKGSGRSKRGGLWVLFKSMAIWAWAILSYVMLVWHAETALSAILWDISMALALAAIGFAVAHDANHGGLFESRWLNRAFGLSFDAIGASSYIWRLKHNGFHHGFTNIEGKDEDLENEPIFRFSPGQVRRKHQRFQHLYASLFYAFLSLKWQFYADFRDVFGKKIGSHTIKPPRGGELLLFWAGKLFFVGWSIVLPAFFHPLLNGLALFLLGSLVLGFMTALVFQLAHCTEGVIFVNERTEDWATHQILTTVNFSRWNRLLTEYVGGLNFQIEHHLFPTVCHVHYPRLSKIVEKTCREYSIPYKAHRTFLGATWSHMRFLRRMGRES